MNGDYKDRSHEIEDTVRAQCGMINERISSLTAAINRLAIKLDRIEDRLSAVENLLTARRAD